MKCLYQNNPQVTLQSHRCSLSCTWVPQPSFLFSSDFTKCHTVLCAIQYNPWLLTVLNILKIIYFLFIYLAALDLSWSMQTLSCGIWRLVPQPEVKLWPVHWASVHWEHRVSHQRPPGKSLLWIFLLLFQIHIYVSIKSLGVRY